MRPPRYYDQDFMAQQRGSHYQGSTEREKVTETKDLERAWGETRVWDSLCYAKLILRKKPTVFQSINTDDFCAFTEIVK